MVSKLFYNIVKLADGELAQDPDEAAMDAASELAKQAFGKMIEEGVVDGDSVHPHTGTVFKSF